eukprot:TRINITY_DN110_c0_g1_i3.p1 TRINITY_DN110_c0_g1~~TRINITY_DN110_c0_g1_i3.p1  ORF type:complete len:168 (+),score=39.26 TRINITY_DN110_c0_g1_i3:226-729(+)
MRIIAVLATFAATVIAAPVPASNVTAIPPGNSTLQSGPAPGGNYFLLRLQKCSSSSDWTIHGLWWQEKNGCGGTFDESAVSDLEGTMDTEWLSCPGLGSNQQFWSHEWSEHGSCTAMDEHTFFSNTLRLYEAHSADCASNENDEECSICFDSNLKACGSVGTSSCSC